MPFTPELEAEIQRLLQEKAATSKTARPIKLTRELLTQAKKNLATQAAKPQ